MSEKEGRVASPSTHAPKAPGFLKGLAIKLLLSLALTVLLLELGAAAVIHAGILPARLPDYAIPKAQEPFVVDIDPHFGSWHRPHRSKVHKRACFDVVYRSNSYGAVDVERPKRSDRSRTLVIGDSFAMGHGVSAEDRFSNVLEHATGIPHLNFGVGGTGPLQYFLRYKYLAREFDHDAVLVSILPDNDFIEDGPTQDRYRPYWEGTSPDYTLQYSFDSLQESPLYPKHLSARLSTHDVLGGWSYFYNAADWVAGARKVLHRRKNAPNYAGYFDFTPEEFARLRRTLEEFSKHTGGARLMILCIPRLIDLHRHEKEGTNPFGSRMSNLAVELDFDFVDLLPPMAKTFHGRERELYLGCDGHWSPTGHKVAAEQVMRAMRR